MCRSPPSNHSSINNTITYLMQKQTPHLYIGTTALDQLPTCPCIHIHLTVLLLLSCFKLTKFDCYRTIMNLPLVADERLTPLLYCRPEKAPLKLNSIFCAACSWCYQFSTSAPLLLCVCWFLSTCFLAQREPICAKLGGVTQMRLCFCRTEGRRVIW